MIRVTPEKHQTVKTISAIAMALVFVGTALFFTYMASRAYLKASSIMDNPETVQADLNLNEMSLEEKDGRVYRTYHFTYAFEQGNDEYTGKFDVAGSNSKPYLEAETVPVVYKVSEPSLHERKKIVEANKDLTSILVRLALAIPVLALLAAILHFLVTRRFITAK